VVPTVRRTLASLAAWTAGAGVAVGVGVLALSLIDNGLASGAVQPVPIDGPVAAAPPSPSPSASLSQPSGEAAPVPSSAPSPSATAGPLRQLASTGGTAIARCTPDGLAYLVSWSPGQGYEADDVHRGPGRIVSVAFTAGTQRVWLGIHCVAGIPERVPGDHHDE
jgi:hypothetical protein